MGKFVVVACLLAACQPMYGDRAEHLHTLSPKPHPAPVPTDPIAFVEDCNFDFHHRAPVAHTVANPQLVTQAGAQLAKAAKAPTSTEQVDIVSDAIATYSRALQADPYDPDATLGLALAYDTVRRKGCALALLKRLGTLADHPKFASSALPVAQSVAAHRVWFRDYRKEALATLGVP